MLPIQIKNETARLRAVLLGTAENSGPAPSLEQAYDPKSREHILANTYPREEDMIREMDQVAEVLLKYNVQVFRPEVLPQCNQIFARDIAFVIDDTLVLSNILPHRERELEALGTIINKLPSEKVIRMPSHAHVEGGDVILWSNYLFVGTYYGADYSQQITARTNPAAVEVLRELFPNRIVKAFDLRKSNSDPRENALHLDCCFQPVGRDLAVIHPNGFLNTEDYSWLLSYFGPNKVFEVDKKEMYDMNCNFFSISPEVVISDRRFKRLNSWLRSKNITVEEVDYCEIAKQEGLLRCSTLPLIRD